MCRFYRKPGGICICALNNGLEGGKEDFSTNKKQKRKIMQKLYIYIPKVSLL
jgi:hypothetical protein